MQIRANATNDKWESFTISFSFLPEWIRINKITDIKKPEFDSNWNMLPKFQWEFENICTIGQHELDTLLKLFK